MYGLTQLMRILNEVKNQRLRLVEFPLGKSARQKTKTTIARNSSTWFCPLINPAGNPSSFLINPWKSHMPLQISLITLPWKFHVGAKPTPCFFVLLSYLAHHFLGIKQSCDFITQIDIGTKQCLGTKDWYDIPTIAAVVSTCQVSLYFLICLLV